MRQLLSVTALFLILNFTRSHFSDKEYDRDGRGLFGTLGLGLGNDHEEHKGGGSRSKGGLLNLGLGSHAEGSKSKGGLLNVPLVDNLVKTLDNVLIGPFGNRRKIFVKPGTTPKKPSDVSKYRHLQNTHNETFLCSKPIWNMEFQKIVTFSTENYGQKGKTYSPKTDCTVLYMGSRNCTPVVSCETPIHLRNRVEGSCHEEFLYINDGLGGGVKYCDSDKINRLIPSNNGKDFYIQLITGQTAPDLSFTGFKCTVTCKSEDQEVIPLKASKKSKKYLSNCVCGLQAKRGDSHRIVGGVTTAEYEYPWLVAIVLKGTRQPVCGGAIINDRHILTAAHCFVLGGLNATDVDIIIHGHLMDAQISGDISNVPLGEKGSIRGIGYNLEHKSDSDENSTRITIDEVICHPMFSEGNGYDNDVAIMKLNQKIDLVSEIGATPICLPKLSPQHDSYKGKLGLVAGWGLGHEDASASNRLLQKLENIPIIDHDKCKALLEEANETISDKMMCAGFLEGGKDSCSGDSGGPLILKQPEGQFTQIGIVSWGSGCARKNAPGVYTDVQQMMAWINYHTSDSHVQWCQESTHNDE